MYGHSIDWFRVARNAALVTAIALIAAINFFPFSPALKPEVWAAWVQAIGSIAAILAAVFLALWQRSVETRKQMAASNLEAVGLSMALLREAKELRSRLFDERKVLHHFNPAQDIWQVSGPFIPQNLWISVRELPKLGPAGGELLRAIYYVQKSREHLNGNYLYREHYPTYLECIESAFAHTEEAVSGMQKLLR